MTTKVEKYQLSEDVFSMPLPAQARSRDLGFEGAIHVYDVDGQAYYMPGPTHEAYLEGMGYGDAPEDETKEILEMFLEVMERLTKGDWQDWGEPVAKADYQGESVELNKPRRTPKGDSKKFEVFVKDGDKVKRVTFGDPDMEIRRDDDEARANFRARHSCDTAKDKTSARYWSCRMWEKGTTVSEATKAMKDTPEGTILKVDDEQRIVYGWASVISEDGIPVKDRQGDIIEADTLVKATNAFMTDVRIGKAMHEGEKVGDFIHSLPLTKELGEALGIRSNREGWIVAMKVYDDDIWAKVKSGELSAFSIGGRAQREEV